MTRCNNRRPGDLIELQVLPEFHNKRDLVLKTNQRISCCMPFLSEQSQGQKWASQVLPLGRKLKRLSDQHRCFCSCTSGLHWTHRSENKSVIICLRFLVLLVRVIVPTPFFHILLFTSPKCFFSSSMSIFCAGQSIPKPSFSFGFGII